MDAVSGVRWFAVQTHSRAEEKAAAHLIRQGFEVYLPRYLRRKRHARRTTVEPAALFPRYLFVAVDMILQRWRVVHSTVGVTRLVCNGDEPALVPDRVIQDLKRRQDDSGYVRLERRPRFAVGDRIHVLEGVFAPSQGLFEGLTDGERVAILLDLLGRKVRVVLDMDCVAAA